MEMVNQVNRLEGELREWQAKEKRFSELFPGDLLTNDAWLKEKLIYLEQLVTKYAGTARPEERMTLRMLKSMRKQVLGKLYNPFFAFLRAILVWPLLKLAYKELHRERSLKNNVELKKELQQAGFSAVYRQVQIAMQSGKPDFDIALSHYTNAYEKLNHTLHFVKDPAGGYSFESFKSVLSNKLDASQDRVQSFSREGNNFIDRDQAYQLLSGRAVEQHGVWKQLDFNDKDTSGDYRLKEFSAQYGYNLEASLKQLPLQLSPGETDRLADKLREGKLVKVSFLANKKSVEFFLSANPQFRSVDIYTSALKKVSLEAALGKKQISLGKPAQQLNQKQNQRKTPQNKLRAVS